MAAHLSNGNIPEALNLLDQNNAIHFAANKYQAIGSLVKAWHQAALDSGEQTSFVFAFTNRDVDNLNRLLREAYRKIGRLKGSDVILTTPQGRLPVAKGDRLVLTLNHHRSGLFNGMTGEVASVSHSKLELILDDGSTVCFDPTRYNTFSYSYAGTIHRGQGRTFDKTFLLHTHHWGARAAYVVLTRHRENTMIFANTNETPDLAALGRAMARNEDKPNAIELDILP